MTATRQLAIILGFVALWEIKFEKMAKVWEKRFRLRILGIFSFLSSDFKMFFVSLFSRAAKWIQYFQFNFLLHWSNWSISRSQSEQYKIKCIVDKLGDGLDESPTVMVGEAATTRQLGKNRGILKPGWAFVETKSYTWNFLCW